MIRIFKIENEKFVASGLADFSALVSSRGDIRSGEDPELEIFDLELLDVEIETLDGWPLSIPEGDELAALLAGVEDQLKKNAVSIAAQIEDEKYESYKAELQD